MTIQELRHEYRLLREEVYRTFPGRAVRRRVRQFERNAVQRGMSPIDCINGLHALHDQLTTEVQTND